MDWLTGKVHEGHRTKKLPCMIAMQDGLGRTLYCLSGSDNYTKRLHPDTLEEMPDDWEMEYPNCNIGVWPYIVILLVAICFGFLIAIK